jgi:exodeoxyribonuclease V beta subunit
MSFDVTRDDLPEGFFAIEASAGTGKTWTLSHLVVRLLLGDPTLDLRSILVVTFTNAAADELATRIRGVLAACRAAAAGTSGATEAAQALVGLGDLALGGRPAVIARLDTCLAGLDELAVGTIHAFCKRVLEGSAFACGEAFASELAPDDGELIATAVRDAWRLRLWGDSRLAQCAATWSIEGDVQVWKRWNRHVGTRIEPALDLDAVLASLETAATAVRAAATPAALAGLAAWRWKSGHDPSLALALLAAAGDPATPDVLDVLGADPPEVFKQHAAEAENHPLLVACRRLVGAVKAVRHAWLGWLCPAVAERLRAGQAAAGILTQDDLLRRVRAALDARPELPAAVRARWPVALIDEFQDTDPVQWEVFRRCHRDGGRLVVVGDPKQAIYRFRGADLDAYIAAVAGVPSARLTTNRRSDPRLVTAVQALIGATSAPFLVPSIALSHVIGVADPNRGELDDGEAPLLVLLPPDEGVPPRRQEAVASEIVHLLSQVRLGQQAVQPRDCAVLVRTSAQAREMRAALRSRGVPATLAADGDVLDSPAAVELRAILAALAKPRDAAALRLALATRAWGRQAADIAALVADDQAWQTLVEAVELCHGRWLRHGLTAAIDGWAAEVGAFDRFAALPEGERWLTDWRHAVEVLHGETAAARLRPAALLAWWERRGSDGAEARRLRLEGDASAVRILTMHVAKGLEFPIVFCPFLGTRYDREDEGVLVAEAGTARLVLGGPGLEAAEAAVAAEDDAEQLRLAYVALTRARVRCYVLWGMWDRQKGHYHLPLRSSLGWWLRPVGESRTDWLAASASGVEGRQQRLADSVDRCVQVQEAGAGLGLRAARLDAGRWQEPAAPIAGDGLRVLPAPARIRLEFPRNITSFTGICGGEAVLERRHGDEFQQPAPSEVEPPSGLRAIARGADLGDALHTALEGWDFAGDPTTLVRTALQPLGLEVSGPRQPHAADPVMAVVDSFNALAVLPIRCGDRELVLGALPDRLRRAEWEFHLPLARVRPERVLALIQAHAAIPAGVLEGLPRLREAAPGGGFLKGFVDLLAGDGSSWWVLDWKSNHLGDGPEDYAVERLWPAMAGHGYLVQALIYVLALHRHLRHRLGPVYSYETHVAGAAWIFLRGVDAGHGVWTWKPPEALVTALEHELLEAQP